MATGRQVLQETLDDDPAAIALAVRALAADLDRELIRIAAGGSGRHDDALPALYRRAGDLLDRVGQCRLQDLRWWLLSLQRRLVALRWVSDVPGTKRPRRDCPDSNATTMHPRPSS